ncbi:hypothetical protein DVH05_004313 [Phytophthora capsici]|nr:hypothetical protein DVH05_004313 [Phytophthora capsici]|eukprot:jgi/Phyca11/503396/fgenesh2_kg.PHYCAscaffold_3_\
MTISRSVYNQLFEQAPDATGGAAKEKVIRLRPTEAKAGAVVMSAKNKIQMWTKEEHERFLAALEKFPAGPWKKVADFIGTKTPRQTMTHAQKYRQKIHRRQRGLRNQKKSVPNTEDNTTTMTSDSPAPVDTKADVNGEPKTIVSPYGVADLQLKPGSEAAVAAAAGATSDQLLTILAQQATINQGDKPEPMEVDSEVKTKETLAEATTVTTADANQESTGNSNLPSLAEILHLGGAEGQTAPAEGDKTETKAEAEAAPETKEKDATESEKQTQSEGTKSDTESEVEETTTQPRPEESSNSMTL